MWFHREVRNRPFHCFFQLLTWTSYGKTVNTTENSDLKISKIAEFESDLLKTNKDIAPQSREILQTFVWWGVELAPHHTNAEHRKADAIIGWLQTRHIMF